MRGYYSAVGLVSSGFAGTEGPFAKDAQRNRTERNGGQRGFILGRAMSWKGDRDTVLFRVPSAVYSANAQLPNGRPNRKLECSSVNFRMARDSCAILSGVDKKSRARSFRRASDLAGVVNSFSYD